MKKLSGNDFRLFRLFSGGENKGNTDSKALNSQNSLSSLALSLFVGLCEGPVIRDYWR